MRDECPLVLGDNVTVGHAVTLHGCVIESRCLIGMGAIILNGATIGAGSIVAAGALITERTAIPAGSLVMGSPGKVKRMLTVIDQASRDLLPPETALWNRVETTARRTFETFGFAEIRLPILEQTELFARSIGLETEVVSKEMYTFPEKLDFLRENLRTVTEAMESEGRL